MIESRLEGLTNYAPEIYSYLMGQLDTQGCLLTQIIIAEEFERMRFGLRRRLYPPPAASAPGPLPLLGAGAVFGFSRKLRKRIKLVPGALGTSLPQA